MFCRRAIEVARLRREGTTGLWAFHKENFRDYCRSEAPSSRPPHAALTGRPLAFSPYQPMLTSASPMPLRSRRADHHERPMSAALAVQPRKPLQVSSSEAELTKRDKQVSPGGIKRRMVSKLSKTRDWTPGVTRTQRVEHDGPRPPSSTKSTDGRYPRTSLDLLRQGAETTDKQNHKSRDIQIPLATKIMMPSTSQIGL